MQPIKALFFPENILAKRSAPSFLPAYNHFMKHVEIHHFAVPQLSSWNQYYNVFQKNAPIWQAVVSTSMD